MRDELIKEYGVSTVRSGGLKVFTTIDPRFQREAVKSIKTNLYEKDDPASALVSINPANGAIRAMTGVAPQRKNLQFNLAAQGRRQAGSAFKTFVLTKAIEEGINPYTTVYLSAPFRWQPDPSCTAAIDPNCVWDVATYSNSYSGRIPIASATLASDNTVYARLTLDLGPENVAEIAKRMGIRRSSSPSLRSGSGRTRSRCSRCLRRTPPSPPAASTRGRWRSARSSSRTAPRTTRPAGASRSASVFSRTGSPTR